MRKEHRLVPYEVENQYGFKWQCLDCEKKFKLKRHAKNFICKREYQESIDLSYLHKKARNQMDTGIGEPTATTERTCRICGCTDSRACEGGCGWVIMFGKQTDICTKCITDEVPKCIYLLVEQLMFLHEPQIDERHNTGIPCITCKLIKFGRKVEAALRQ